MKNAKDLKWLVILHSFSLERPSVVTLPGPIPFRGEHLLLAAIKDEKRKRFKMVGHSTFFSSIRDLIWRGHL